MTPTRISKAMCLPLTTLAAAASCAAPVELACRSIIRPGVVAHIVDATSGRPAAYGASLVAVSASTYDSLELSTQALPFLNPADSSTASELQFRWSVAPGRYAVRVRKPGFQLWQLTSVDVPADRCGSVAVGLTVALQRAP